MSRFPRFIVYAGPNGAGKSTLREIGDDSVDIVIDPDRIARDISPWAPERAQVQAGRAAVLLFNRSIAAGKSVSLETTLSGSTILRRITDASQAGYEILLRFIALESVELHINRIEQRVMKGGHHIPTETLLRRYQASLDNLPHALRLVDHATILDNSGREQKILLRSEYGVILDISASPPSWFASPTRGSPCPGGLSHPPPIVPPCEARAAAT